MLTTSKQGVEQELGVDMWFARKRLEVLIEGDFALRNRGNGWTARTCRDRAARSAWNPEHLRRAGRVADGVDHTGPGARRRGLGRHGGILPAHSYLNIARGLARQFPL